METNLSSALVPFQINFQIKQVSEDSLLLLWPEIIDENQHQQIIACQNLIKGSFTEQVIEAIPAYNSLSVYFDLLQISGDELTSGIINRISAANAENNDNSPSESTFEKLHANNVEIPVYYGEEAGWDMLAVSKETGLSKEEIIRLHSQISYRAYALGFVPGFCYLAQLDDALKLPRRSTPRIEVPAGAVAIAESQTAVYPCKSPGGWHILGQTPYPLYSTKNNSFDPAISVGDIITFKSITKSEFLAMGGKLTIEKSPYSKREAV